MVCAEPGDADGSVVYEHAGQLLSATYRRHKELVSDFLKRELGCWPYAAVLSGKYIFHPRSRAVFSKSGLGFTATACREIANIS